MRYIKATAQPQGHPGRTYYSASYHHDDGSSWIGIVDDVLPGETEITAEAWQAIAEANHDFNVAFEQDRLEKADITDDERDSAIAAVQAWPRPDAGLARFHAEAAVDAPVEAE